MVPAYNFVESQEISKYADDITELSTLISHNFAGIDEVNIKYAIEKLLAETIKNGGNAQNDLNLIKQQVKNDPHGDVAQKIVNLAKAISPNQTEIIKNRKSTSTFDKMEPTEDNRSMADVPPNPTLKSESTQNHIEQNSTVDFEKYNNPQYDFQMNYPANWSLLEGNRIPGAHIEGVTPVVAFVPPGELATSDAFTAFVEVSINHVADDLNLDELLQDNIHDIMKDHSLSNLVIKDASPNGLLSGKPAYLLSYSADRSNVRDETTFVVKEIGTKVGNDYYFINYIVSKDKEEKYLPLAQTMVKSFKITNMLKD